MVRARRGPQTDAAADAPQLLGTGLQADQPDPRRIREEVSAAAAAMSRGWRAKPTKPPRHERDHHGKGDQCGALAEMVGFELEDG